MNITALEHICKLKAREVFNSFKDTVINNPFGNINLVIVKDCLDFEIKQRFCSSVLKTFLKTNNLSTATQVIIATDIINRFQQLIIKTALNWVQNEFNLRMDLFIDL